MENTDMGRKNNGSNDLELYIHRDFIQYLYWNCDLVTGWIYQRILHRRR